MVIQGKAPNIVALENLKEKRLEFRRSRRIVMFTADVTFIAISLPLLLGRSITGPSLCLVAASFILAVLCLFALNVLIRSDERELLELEDKVRTSEVKVGYVGATSTRSEKICNAIWGPMFALALLCMLAAVVLSQEVALSYIMKMVSHIIK